MIRLLSILLAVLPACSVAQQHQLVGRSAPEWEVPSWFQLPDGRRRLTVTDFRGKVVYLYCFQSWCPACHSHGFPTLQKLVTEHGKQDDVAFVAVQTVFEGFSTNTLERAKQVAKRYELEIPFGHDAGRDGKRSQLQQTYRTGGTPWTVIIDKRGTIRFADFTIEVAQASKLIERLRAEKIEPNPLLGKPLPALSAVEWRAAAPRFADAELTLIRWWSDSRALAGTGSALASVANRYAVAGLRVAWIHRGPTDLETAELRARISGSPETLLGVDAKRQSAAAVAKGAGWQPGRDLTVLVDRGGVVRWVHQGDRLHPSEHVGHAAANADYLDLEATISKLLGNAEREREPGK